MERGAGGWNNDGAVILSAKRRPIRFFVRNEKDGRTDRQHNRRGEPLCALVILRLIFGVGVSGVGGPKINSTRFSGSDSHCCQNIVTVPIG